VATPNNPYAPQPVSVAEQLRQAYIGLEQIKKQLINSKRGTTEYTTAKANLEAAKKRIANLETQDKAERDAAKGKESTDKRAKLTDALERAKDYGTADDVTKAQNALNAFDGKNPEIKTSASTFQPSIGSGGKVSTTVTSGTTTNTTTSTTGGVTGGASNKGKAPAVDPKTAWIGYLQATFKTLPQEFKNEIDKIFDQALAPNSGWTQDTFNEAIQQTKWYQQTLPSIRSFFLETNDPRNQANFAEKLQIETANVAAKLENLGIRTQQVDPVTGKVYDNTQTIQGIALSKLQNGWTDVQLTQHLGDNAQLLFTGGGTIGSSVSTIRNAALSYGINLDKNYLNTIQTSLLDMTDGRDTNYYLNEMRNQAMDLYKPFAESIKSGRTLYEITNNYRTKMSDLLEVDPENLSWKDMMNKVIDPTTGNARMLSDFTKQVKQDPLWQYTKNAKETYSNMAADLMKQFGFMG
jgi:hypothetical protein